LAIFLGFLVSLVYGLRKIDPQFTALYFPTLYLIPTLLIIFRRVKISEMGFKIGKPIDGLVIAFVLPLVLFLRFRLMGSFWSPSGRD